ncbi:hypothetical protein FV228_09400 [Methylobacterium sp. WL18]|nr:hypothetical protein FV233_23865 [Methylobacterium sp. WL7]TXN72655.1 hypothetical protein FV228_09400 [Methylobacterium sp. WL18]
MPRSGLEGGFQGSRGRLEPSFEGFASLRHLRGCASFDSSLATDDDAAAFLGRFIPARDPRWDIHRRFGPEVDAEARRAPSPVRERVGVRD